MAVDGRPAAARERRLARATDVLSRHGAFGVLVLGRDGVLPVTLAGSGELLWNVLAVPHTESEVVDALALEYRGARATIAADIGPVLQQLIELAVIEVVS